MFYLFVFSRIWTEYGEIVFSPNTGKYEPEKIPHLDTFHIVTFCPTESKNIIEAVTRDVLTKKVFLKILQNLQEKTCARVSFLINLQALGLQLY